MSQLPWQFRLFYRVCHPWLSTGTSREHSRRGTPCLGLHPRTPSLGFIVISGPVYTAFPPAPILSFGQVATTQSTRMCQLGPFQPQERREVNHSFLPISLPLLHIQPTFDPPPFITCTFGASQEVS